MTSAPGERHGGGTPSTSRVGSTEAEPGLPAPFPDPTGLAWTAHELRGPVVAAAAAIDRFLSTPDDRDEELLRRAQLELVRVGRDLDGLLRWPVTGDASPDGPVDLVELDLVEAVHDAVATSSLEFRDGDVRVQGPSSLVVQADRVLIGAVIGNLLRNALTYSPARLAVLVSVEDAGDTARVSVLDRGPGIDHEDLATLFDPFARGRLGRARKHGTGLGLFIAQSVVQAHGGRILVASRPGQTVFHVELPKHRAGAGT